MKLLHEFAEALLRGELPAAAARLFVAGAISAWLREGGRVGDLERHYLKVTARERSRLTPARLLARCARTTTSDPDADNMAPSLDGDDDDEPDER